MTTQYLLVMDIPGIKEYVFGTDRLVEIRGASALLNKLNRKDTVNFLENELGKSNVECIFAGGGAGQFVVNAEANQLKTCIDELKGLFVRETKGGLRLICGIAEFSDESKYQESLKQAHLDLKQEKEEKPILPCSQIHNGYIRECDSCSGMASQLNDYSGEEKWLCDVCARKVREGREKGLWKELAFYLEKKGLKSNRPGTFEEIGERCQSKSRKGYTALVYADGNAMGKLVKQIDTRENFHFFSNTVDKAVREACHESLEKNCKPVNGKIPANILLLGGDDLMVYLSADTAFSFAIDAARRFTEKTEQRFSTNSFFAEILKGEGLTISLGIAFGKSHTPFSIMFSQAEELLKSAKQSGSFDKSKTEYYAPPYIDFHFSSNYNQLKVSDSRKDHLTLNRGKIRLYQKPYSLPDAEKLMLNARQLVEKNIPNTRLRRFGYAPSLGRVNGTLECLKLFVGTRDSEKRQAIWDVLNDFGCVANIPWKEDDEKDETTTVLADLIELTGFIN